MSWFLRNWAQLYAKPTVAENALEPAVAAVGKRYRAQHPFFDLGYIADFAMLDDRVVVEVDGTSHHGLKAKIKDLTRTLALFDKGWRVVRISNADAVRDPAGALSNALMSTEYTRPQIVSQLTRAKGELIASPGPAKAPPPRPRYTRKARAPAPQRPPDV